MAPDDGPRVPGGAASAELGYSRLVAIGRGASAASEKRVNYGGFIAMMGGPDRGRLALHEHPELQISVHFGKTPSISLTAGSEPHSGSWEAGERVAVMLLSPALLSEVSDDLVHVAAGPCVIRSKRPPSDPLIREVGQVVWNELSGATFSLNRRLYFESLGYVLAGHLIRSYAEARPRLPSAHTLTTRQLERLSEFVDNALDQTIGVREMASTVGLTPRYFSDAFKRTTGQTPYQYVINKRIDHAKRLLRGRLPIAELALQLGFANQSHFTAVFARVAGITPSRWRSRL